MIGESGDKRVSFVISRFFGRMSVIMTLPVKYDRYLVGGGSEGEPPPRKNWSFLLMKVNFLYARNSFGRPIV